MLMVYTFRGEGMYKHHGEGVYKHHAATIIVVADCKLNAERAAIKRYREMFPGRPITDNLQLVDSEPIKTPMIVYAWDGDF